MQYLPLLIAAAAAVVVWFVLNNLLFAAFVLAAVLIAAYFYVPSFKTYVLGLVGLAEKDFAKIVSKVESIGTELDAFVVQEEQKAKSLAEEITWLQTLLGASKVNADRAKVVRSNINNLLGKSSS